MSADKVMGAETVGFESIVDCKEKGDPIQCTPHEAECSRHGSAPVAKSAMSCPSRNRRVWSSRDDDCLRMSWGIHPIKQVARELGRSPIAVYVRAKRLELGLGCPQGFEAIASAAKRAGFSHSTMLRILRWANVHVRPAAAHPSAPNHVRIVEPADVDAAVADWCRRETIAEAARRVGYSTDTLRIALNRAADRGEIDLGPQKLRRRQEWRLLPETVDAVVGTRAARETWASASRRTGHSINTLRSWMWRAGFRKPVDGRRWEHDPADIDRVVAERRATSCRASRATKRIEEETRS